MSKTKNTDGIHQGPTGGYGAGNFWGLLPMWHRRLDSDLITAYSGFIKTEHKTRGSRIFTKSGKIFMFFVASFIFDLAIRVADSIIHMMNQSWHEKPI